jgi:hypothetical protein
MSLTSLVKREVLFLNPLLKVSSWVKSSSTIRIFIYVPLELTISEDEVTLRTCCQPEIFPDLLTEARGGVGFAMSL